MARKHPILNDEVYRNAIRKKVCEHCIDLSEAGHCTLTGDRQCGVELYLGKIIEVVHSIQSPHLQDYVKVLRERVCTSCKNQNPDGTCRLRSEADCGLDRYFALVVETIEEVDKQ
ncbi:MAG: hypothetical protein HY351_03975 [Candidatus Omnitrophica bacterium]|nr:hypothetical protein [Candidatus Omnitrophota bacterium]